MSAIAVDVGRQVAREAIKDIIEEILRRWATRRIIAAGGQRAAGIIGGLLTPEIIGKVIAIGFAIWTVWSIIEILTEFFALKEYIQKAADKLSEEIIDEYFRNHPTPDPEDFQRLIECLKKCVAEAVSKVSVIDLAISGGVSLDGIVKEMKECMRKCLG